MKNNTLFCIVAKKVEKLIEIEAKAYRVSTLDPEEVTVPENTIMFNFFEKMSPEDALENFVYLRIDKVNFIDISIPEQFFRGQTLYFVGEKIMFGGRKCCINKKTDTIIPMIENAEIAP